MVRSLLVTFVILCASSMSAGTFTLHEAIEFATPAEESLLLDLRVPDGPGPHPVIVYLHSGAWVMGDRTGGPARRQATRGYAVASIEYRLAPKHVWPAQVEDVKAAVRWLRANAARFNLDPERVGIFGTSAGAHIGSVAATSHGVDWLEGLTLGNAQFDSGVKVVVDLYGPTDLLRIEKDKLPCIPLDGNADWMPMSLLMGCPIQQCQEWTRTASPMSYVTPDDPAFLIMHGMLDCLVPFTQSTALHQKLQAAGVWSKLVLIPKGDHGGDVFDEPQYKDMIDAFLDEKLRGPLATDAPKRRRAVGRI